MFNWLKKKKKEEIPVPELPELPPTPEPEKHEEPLPKDQSLVVQPEKELMKSETKVEIDSMIEASKSFKKDLLATNKEIAKTNKALTAMRKKLGKL